MCLLLLLGVQRLKDEPRVYLLAYKLKDSRSCYITRDSIKGYMNRVFGISLTFGQVTGGLISMKVLKVL